MQRNRKNIAWCCFQKITTKYTKHSQEKIEVDKMGLKNIHPGEILLEEFIIPLLLSQNKLAREVYVPPEELMRLY